VELVFEVRIVILLTAAIGHGGQAVDFDESSAMDAVSSNHRFAPRESSWGKGIPLRFSLRGREWANPARRITYGCLISFYSCDSWIVTVSPILGVQSKGILAKANPRRPTPLMQTVVRVILLR